MNPIQIAVGCCVLRELAISEKQQAYFTGVLTHEVEQARIEKELDTLKHPPTVDPVEEPPKRRRHGDGQG